MAKINILDKSVYNLISAGEVVERPSSVVKELVENACDAKATNISIEIINGGINKIRISDNGVGMLKDDLSICYLPHSTSKIKTAEDLSKISTLGFRGEALSSITTVSKTTIISKTENAENGNKIQVFGGELLVEEPCSATNGTSILVEDLFYNVPARAKFLRKPKQEESEITNLIIRLMLGNPNIAFKYVADDKLIYQTYGTNLKDAIYAIYGKNTVENLIPVNFSNELFNFNGFICKPIYSKPNRTYQTLNINGRYVINASVSTAISKAYDNFLMKGQFPFYVLNLELPLEKVDVNIHPNKLDVKFENPNEVFGFVLNNISSALFGIDNIKSLNIAQQAIKDNFTLDKSKLKVLDSNIGINYQPSNKSNFEPTTETNNIIKQVNITNEEAKNNDKVDTDRLFSLASFLADGKVNGFETDNGFIADMCKTKSVQEDLFKSTSVNENNLKFSEYKVVGTAFNTYVIIEKGESLYFIDQHAGHERILFDKFMAEISSNNVVRQQLLIPYVLELNSIETNHIKNNLIEIENLGFEIEEFGKNSFKISSTPMLLKDISINEFFNEFLKNIDSNIDLKNSDLMRKYIAKCACKSAVKAFDVLSDSEINSLLNSLNNLKSTFLCPHGRPIIIEIKNKDIEKWFKRIV